MKVTLYDRYLRKMEEALQDGDWLIGDRFSFADIAMTPYVMRLDMLSMQGMWAAGRMPRVEAWLANVKGRESFQPAIWKWMPDDLTGQLRVNGAKSWPEVAALLDIEPA